MEIALGFGPHEPMENSQNYAMSSSPDFARHLKYVVNKGHFGIKDPQSLAVLYP